MESFTEKADNLRKSYDQRLGPLAHLPPSLYKEFLQCSQIDFEISSCVLSKISSCALSLKYLGTEIPT